MKGENIMNNKKPSNGSSEEFRRVCAEAVFSGGYTIERAKGYDGGKDKSIPYKRYLAGGVYDDTCRGIPTPPYCGDNVR